MACRIFFWLMLAIGIAVGPSRLQLCFAQPPAAPALQPNAEADALQTQPPQPSSDAGTSPSSNTNELTIPPLAPLPPTAFQSSLANGLTASMGATRGSSSAAPNMIGDLFNAGTSSLNFNASFTATPVFGESQTNAIYVPDASTLANGISTPFNGVIVTSLSNIGDLVKVGDSTFISASDLYPIKNLNVQTSTLDGANNIVDPEFNGQVEAAAPVDNSQIFAAANRAITSRFTQGFGSQVSVQDLVTLQYRQANSSLTGGNGYVQSALYTYDAAVSIAVPSPGEVIGRFSIADNNSPIPRDRLFFDYNFFHNARITSVGIPVNRWAPGFESTFADGLASIEFRAPMAVTLSSSINTSGQDLVAYEFGDISFALKGLLHQNDQMVLSSGLGITLPTADDFRLTLDNNSQVVQVKNQAVHLVPFLAGAVYPSENTFLQTFTQLDFDANGNSVFLDEQGFFLQPSTGLQNVGRLKSQTTLRYSNSAGAFLIRNRQGRVSNLAAVVEAHYTATLNRSDSVGSANFAIGDPTRTLNVLNLTTGLHTYLGKSVLTTAYGVPVTTDRVFDGELRVFINRYF